MNLRIVAGIVIIILMIVAVVILLSLKQTPFKPQFADILNLSGVNNSNQLLNQIGIGVKNNTDFNITYQVYAIFPSNPLYSGLRYSANASISRAENLLYVSMSTQNPSSIFNNQQNGGLYVSSSEYNGSGFALCYGSNSGCQFNKAKQNANFAGEIASAFSNLFNGKFLSSPYLSIMNSNYSISNGSEFSLLYLSQQVYGGNGCAYMQVSSTNAFYVSTGATVSGYACFSEALGVPLYAKLIVTYGSTSFDIDISSSLTNKTSI